MQFEPVLSPPSHHTRGQRRLRQRIAQLPLRRGVRLAARTFFGFTHRANFGNALWSDREGVWLGRATFLHWSLCDTAIDIPWLVADAADAPERSDELEEAVRRELMRYWAARLASLPRKDTPAWLPLP